MADSTVKKYTIARGFNIAKEEGEMGKRYDESDKPKSLATLKISKGIAEGLIEKGSLVLYVKPKKEGDE